MAIELYSASQSPLGTSIYTLSGVDAPAMYVPRLYKKTVRNKSNTNIEVTIDTNYPLVTEEAGTYAVRNTFKMRTTFTALQSVISNTERARIFDEHVAYLTAQKAKILIGDATP